MKLEVAIDTFLAHLAVERGLSPATVEAYGHDLAALAGSLGPVAVGRIDAAGVRGHLARLEALQLVKHRPMKTA